MTFVSFSQNYEDVMLWRALKDVSNGFYVDVGANDPTVESVTKAFYDRGWRGINIEPVIHFHNKLCVERPEDINLRTAVGDKKGKAPFFEVVDTGLSTMNPEIAKKHSDELDFEIKQYDIPVSTLTDIINEHVEGEVHFLKIDVEGYEKHSLLGLDLLKIRPWIIVVESTIPLTQDENFLDWENILIRGNYHFIYFDGLNRFYVANEKAELDEHFDRPPNYFDFFERVNKIESDQRGDDLFQKLEVVNHQFSAIQSQYHEALTTKSEDSKIFSNIATELLENQQKINDHMSLTMNTFREEKAREIATLLETQEANLEGIREEKAREIATLLETQEANLEGIREEKAREIATLLETQEANLEAIREEKAREIATLLETQEANLEGIREEKAREIATLLETQEANLEGIREEKAREIATLLETQEANLEAIREEKAREIATLLETQEANLEAIREEKAREIATLLETQEANLEAIREEKAREIATLLETQEANLEAIREEKAREIATLLETQEANLEGIREEKAREIATLLGSQKNYLDKIIQSHNCRLDEVKKNKASTIRKLTREKNAAQIEISKTLEANIILGEKIDELNNQCNAFSNRCVVMEDKSRKLLLKNEGLNHSLAEITDALHAAQIEIESQTEKYNAILKSTSWKITSPLRVIVNYIKFIRRYLLISTYHLINKFDFLKKITLLILSPIPPLKARLKARMKSDLVILSQVNNEKTNAEQSSQNWVLQMSNRQMKYWLKILSKDK